MASHPDPRIPPRRRLTVLLTLGVLGVLLLIGLPFLFAFHKLERTRQIQILEGTTGSLGQVLVEGLRSSMLAGQPHLLDEAVRNLSRQSEVERVMILDDLGRVSVSSDPAYESRVFDKDDDEMCIVCHRPDEGSGLRRAVVTREDDARFLRAVNPIPNDNECHACHDPRRPINGLLIMDLSLRSADEWFVADIRNTLILAGVMVLITIAGLAWLLGRMVYAPLRTMVDTCRRIAGGDLGARVPLARSGEFALVAAHMNDMTDHLARTLDEVEAHRRDLEVILHAVDDEILVLDRQGSIVAANRAARARLGASAGEVMASADSEPAVGRWQHAEAGQTVEEVFRSGRLQKNVVSLQDPDGRDLAVEIHASPILDPDGEVRQVVEVRRDITERRQLEGSLVHSERLASLGLLASGLSHEINNPLGAISAGVEGLRRWLRSSTELPPDVEKRLDEVLDRIGRETMRGRSITDRLLRLARPSPSTRSLIDLPLAVEETVGLLAHVIKQSRIEVEIVPGEPVPPLVADESRVKQVILNLVLNALQSMEQGAGTLRVTTTADRETVRLDIEDTGVGIPSHLLKQIFDPFFTTKPPGQGTGLGLFITHRLVTEMGGTIRVRSKEHEGSVFSVVFPRS